MPLNKEAVQAVKESVQEAVDAVVKYWLQHKSPSNLVTKEHDILVLAVAQATAVATQTAFNYRDARGNLQSPSDVLETLIMLEVGRALLPVTMEFSATEIDRLHKTLFIISVKSTVLSAVVSALFEEIAFFHRDSSPRYHFLVFCISLSTTSDVASNHAFLVAHKSIQITQTKALRTEAEAMNRNILKQTIRRLSLQELTHLNGKSNETKLP